MAAVSKASFRERRWVANGQSKSAWGFSFYIIEGSRRRRVERSGFGSKRSAESAFRDCAKEVTDGIFDTEPKPEAPSLKAFTERYLAEGTAGKRPRSIAQDKLAFKWFMEHVPGETALDEISPEQIDTFIAKRLKEKPRKRRTKKTVSEATVRREVTSIRRLFNVAVRWRILTSNPTEGAVKPTSPEGDVVFLEIDEQRALLKACHEIDAETRVEDGIETRHNSAQDTPYLRPIVAVALYAGLRAAEIFHLAWNDFDFERKRLTVRNTAGFTTKTKKNRVLELHPALAREMTAWKQWFASEIERAQERIGDKSLHIQLRRKAEERLAILRRCEPKPFRLAFPSFRTFDEQTGEPLPLDNVKKGLKRAVKEAGIKRRVGLHSLRHTFAVTLARENVPLTKISKALGHSNLKTTQIYLRFMPDEGADVTSRIPDLGDVLLPPSPPSQS